MKNKFNKKNKKISQKTNINIKINNNDTKRRRRQPNRKRPNTRPPSSYNMNPFGMNLGYSQNPYSQRDNEEFNKKLMMIQDDVKNLSKTVVTKIEDVSTPETKDNNTLQFTDLPGIIEHYESERLPKIMHKYFKSQMGESKFTDIIDKKHTGTIAEEKKEPIKEHKKPQVKMTRAEVLIKARAAYKHRRDTEKITSLKRSEKMYKDHNNLINNRIGMTDEDFNGLRY
jgi:hypothetical protein